MTFGRVSINFCWYDFWIGFYWNRNVRILYVCIVPMFPISIDCMQYEKVGV